MQITDDIHSLKIPFSVDFPAGGKIPRFVYCHLIFGREIWLIDSGVAGSEETIADYLEAEGRSMQEISTLILTHSHPDHIGAAAAVQRLSGCAVLAHEAERGWIEDVDLQAEERPVPGFGSLVGGSVFVERTVQDGEMLHPDVEKKGPALQVLHTPGHSSGSISLWMAREGALFSADAIPVKGDMPIYQDYSASVSSVKRLAALSGIEHLLAAWDRPRTGDEAYGIMDQALQYLEDINSSVLAAAEADPTAGPMQICQSVLGRLGLPQFMANPLVAASFQSSLKARGPIL